MFEELSDVPTTKKLCTKVAAKPRVKKSVLKIYKSRKPKTVTEEASIPFPANNAGMLLLMEHLNNSSVKLQAELQTTRCELSSMIKKLDDKTLDKLASINSRQETMEILFEALEGEVESIKRLMQLQLDCLHGIFNAIIFIRSSMTGGNVPQNESSAFQPQYPRSSPGLAFTPQNEAPCPPSGAIIPAPDAPMRCTHCKRDFTKRSNFNRHCVIVPKYCALQRTRRERSAKKLPKNGF